MKPFIKLTHKILNVETQIVETWTIEQMLEEINRDHSDEFISSDEGDYKIGWDEWVQNAGYYKFADEYVFEHVTTDTLNYIFETDSLDIQTTDDIETIDEKLLEVITSTFHTSKSLTEIKKYLDQNAEVGFYDFILYKLYEQQIYIAIHK